MRTRSATLDWALTTTWSCSKSLESPALGPCSGRQKKHLNMWCIKGLDLKSYIHILFIYSEIEIFLSHNIGQWTIYSLDCTPLHGNHNQICLKSVLKYFFWIQEIRDQDKVKSLAPSKRQVNQLWHNIFYVRVMSYITIWGAIPPVSRRFEHKGSNNGVGDHPGRFLNIN
jgi:hypothetical protein